MKLLLLCLSFILLGADWAQAADEKIDPSSYICAELAAANLDGQPPIYEGLQLDGYYSAKEGNPYADASILAPLLVEVSDSCNAEPTDKALAHWKMARKNMPPVQVSLWNAKKFTCADYAADPDEGSGFVIWLDAYNRGLTGKSASVLSSQEAIDNFVEVCKANPGKLMLDVINENARE